MSEQPQSRDETSVARFFDSRSAYMMFSTATNEKTVIANQIAARLDGVEPGPHALRIFDAGMGDARVLEHLMRRMHKQYMHIPWLIVGKEISIEDVRLALEKLPDRFYEHPELVFVVTNMRFSEAPSLTPSDPSKLAWRDVALEGSTSADFASQIRDLYADLTDSWAVQTSPKTGNPLNVNSSVLVLYRSDRQFLLSDVIPEPGNTEGLHDLIIASQPYRARTTAEHKVRTVLAPLSRALAAGGQLIGIHAHGEDPGLEIIRGVWPHENPFTVGRNELREAFLALVDDEDLEFETFDDDEAIFKYQLHAMPSEVKEHIGTSLMIAAWNAAAYVAQIEEDRLAEAMSSGVYVDATREVLQRHEGIWFNDELYVISRRS